MKKRWTKVLALTLTLAMIPVMAFGASKSPSNDDSDSSSSASSQVENDYVGGNGASGTSVTTPAAPTVKMNADGEYVAVGPNSTDKLGIEMGLIAGGTTASGSQVSMEADGSIRIGNVSVTFAVNEEETAGLPAEAVEVINRLNTKGTGLSDAAIPGMDLTNYRKLGNTRTLKLAADNGALASAEISMVVPALPDGTSEVIAVYFDHATGKWMRAPAAFNKNTKTVTFTATGSCTVQFIWH